MRRQPQGPCPFPGSSSSSARISWKSRPRSSSAWRPGREVRLRYAYFLTCREAIKNDAGDVVELRCTYDPETKGGNAPDGRKVKATIHWVSAGHALKAEVRLYNHLFRDVEPDVGENLGAALNEDSLEVLQDCRLEPSLADASLDTPIQFERQGYFALDPDSGAGGLIFNRTVALRDSWAKVQAKTGAKP